MWRCFLSSYHGMRDATSTMTGGPLKGGETAEALRRPRSTKGRMVESFVPWMRNLWRLQWLALCLLLSGGCASLIPAEHQPLRDAQAFADATTQAYGGTPIVVFAGPQDPALGAFFKRGRITLNQDLLTSPFLDVLMAHELGHAVLGHEGPVSLKATQFLSQRELDANAKAVEILVRIKGKTEAEALRSVLAFLRSVQWAFASQQDTVLPVGHPPLCVQIDDLLRRFPDHQHWAASFDCGN